MNLNVGNNISARTATYVAKRLRVPLYRGRRPVDFYARLFLDGHPEIGTNFRLADSHFADGVLGDLGGAPYLIGGYSADVMLSGGSSRVERDPIADAAREGSRVPRSATYTGLIDMDSTDASLVHERQLDARAALGDSALHGRLTDYAHASLHRPDFGHFAAASRNYAIYEPFMSKRVIELSFRMTDALKRSTPKSYWYEPFLDGSELSVMFRTRQRTERLIRRLTRVGLSPQGEWSEREGPLQERLDRAVRRARIRLNESLGVEISAENPGRVE